MCAHAEHLDRCPLCEMPTFFNRNQVAFLEDLLINGGCMPALLKEKHSAEPENCRHCAENIVRLVEKIREMQE